MHLNGISVVCIGTPITQDTSPTPLQPPLWSCVSGTRSKNVKRVSCTECVRRYLETNRDLEIDRPILVKMNFCCSSPVHIHTNILRSAIHLTTTTSNMQSNIDKTVHNTSSQWCLYCRINSAEPICCGRPNNRFYCGACAAVRHG